MGGGGGGEGGAGIEHTCGLVVEVHCNIAVGEGNGGYLSWRPGEAKERVVKVTAQGRREAVEV